MSKKPKDDDRDDPNVTAKSILDAVTAADQGDQPKKNPAAVALGRLGGLKGGKARAKKLSKKRRSAIAKAAAVARWSMRRE